MTMSNRVDFNDSAVARAIACIRFRNLWGVSWCFVVLLAVTIAGCSQKSDNNSDSHVAANVNGVEITLREVEALYNRTAAPGTSATVAQDQKRSILSGLVRSELLAQGAVKMKLDRSPEFILAMHEARRQVLAGLAEQNITSSTKPLSPEIIRKIVSENPQYFAGRKLLVYEEVMIPGVDLPLLGALNASANHGASLDQLVDELKSKKVQYRRVKLTQMSDQLQPVIFRVLSGSKPGVPLVARVEDKFAIILLLHSMQSVPLEGAAAEQVAGSMMFARQKNMVIAKRLTELTDEAKINYFGEFAPVVSGKKGARQNIVLPAPDTGRFNLMWSRYLKIGVLLASSYALAMMLLSSSMRLLKGSAWLPRLWPGGSAEVAPLSKFDLPYQPGVLVHWLVTAIAVLSALALGYQFLLIRMELPLWVIITAALTGILSGIAGTYLFVHSPLRQWTRNVKGLPIIFFSLLLLLFVLWTNRFVSI